MAKHTAKAVHSTTRNARSGHTATARGNVVNASQHPRSKHTTVAQGRSHAPAQGSKGGGTSPLTSSYLGKATRSYQRRSSTGVPMAR